MLASVVILVASLALRGDDAEFAAAMKRYQDAVRVLVSEVVLREADIAPAPEAIAALAATGDVAALDALGGDATRLAERHETLVVERGKKAAELEQVRAALKDETGEARKKHEDRAKELDDRLGEIAEQLPLAQRLRDALFDGVLAVLDRVGASDPEKAFELLGSHFKSDVAAVAELDLRIDDLEARARTAAAQLTIATGDERDRIERDAAELGARISSSKEDLARMKLLESRRIAALARTFALLAPARRKVEVDRIRRDLDKDTEWPVRAFRAELFGALPAESVVADLVTVMHQSQRAKAAIEKSLEPLRETYDRAAKALVQAMKGNPSVLPAATVQSEEKARRELQAASANAFGESRVLEACSRGLAAQLAVLTGDARNAAVELVAGAIAKEADSEVEARLVQSLGGVADEPARTVLRGIAEKAGDLRARLAALDALAGNGGDDPTVDLAVTTLLKDADWRVRAAAMRFLVLVPRKAAVPALIASLSVEVGRLVDDAERSLSELTGQSFHGDAKLWKEWWAANEATFDPRARADTAGAVANAAKPDAPAPERVSFYGIQTRSQRVLFVVDRSGSMDEPLSGDKRAKPDKPDKTDKAGKSGTKMAAAKAELKASLAGFHDGDHFNIITYSTDVTRWQRRMVERSDKTARAAQAWVDKDVMPLGGTNVYDALREAFQLAGIGAVDKAYEAGVDTIFFLTDGKPSVGEVIDPNEILVRVREWNRLSRIVIHTIGVGKDQDEVFLRRLAEENGGQYARK